MVCVVAIFIIKLRSSVYILRFGMLMLLTFQTLHLLLIPAFADDS